MYITYKNGETKYFEHDPTKPYVNPGHFNQLSEEDFVLSFSPELRKGVGGLLKRWVNGLIGEEETLP